MGVRTTYHVRCDFCEARTHASESEYLARRKAEGAGFVILRADHYGNEVFACPEHAARAREFVSVDEGD
jgi:hypothetical protein